MENHTTSPPKMQVADTLRRVSDVCERLELDGIKIGRALYCGSAIGVVEIYYPLPLYQWFEKCGYRPILIKRHSNQYPAILVAEVNGVNVNAICDHSETEKLINMIGSIRNAEDEA